MTHHSLVRHCTLAALLGVTAIGTARVEAQPTRLSDTQVERLLERMEKNADAFRESLDDALDRSRVDDSKLEDQLNDFVKKFEDATDRLEKRFDDDKAAGSDVEDVLSRAAEINALMTRVAFTDRARNDWRVLRTDLDELARAYGVAWEWRVAVRP